MATAPGGQGERPWLWKKGQSGNPAGRRKGSKNRATLWAQALAEGKLDTLMERIVDRATAKDDGVAQRFLVARVLPVARERRIPLELPEPTGWAARDARD